MSRFLIFYCTSKNPFYINNTSFKPSFNQFKNNLFRLPYFETSAATGENVNESVNHLLDLVSPQIPDILSDRVCPTDSPDSLTRIILGNETHGYNRFKAI